MGKIVRVSGRGTKRRTAEKESDNWTGEEYKKLQKGRKEAAKNRHISMGRGTRRVKYGDVADTPGRPSGKGRYVSSGRGTKKRKVE